MRGGCSPRTTLANDKIDRPTIDIWELWLHGHLFVSTLASRFYTETKRRSFAARSKIHHSLKSPACSCGSITLSLPRGEQKRQNPSREAVGKHTGSFSAAVRVTSTGR